MKTNLVTFVVTRMEEMLLRFGGNEVDQVPSRFVSAKDPQNAL